MCSDVHPQPPSHQQPPLFLHHYFNFLLLEAKQAFKNSLEVSPNHFQMKICASTIGSKGQLTS
jgi:hypothetical protein